MVKTTIYLSEELKTYVENRARETGASEAEVIRTAILLMSEAQPVTRKRPRSFGAFPSDTVRGRDFEEWLAENWERDW
jgi:hypothetical protein